MLEVEPATMVFTPSNWSTPQDMVARMTDVALAVKALQTISISVAVHDQANSDTLYRDTAGFDFPVQIDNSNLAPRFDRERLASVTLSLDETPGRTTLAAAREIGPLMSVYAVDTDNDSEDLSYSIVGDSLEFEIDEVSGQLRIRAGAHFNHERFGDYVVTMRVSDNDLDFPGHEDVLVRFNIRDLDEKPSDYVNHGFMVAGMTRDAVTIEWNNDDFEAQYDEPDRGRIVLGYGGGGRRVTMELPVTATGAVIRGLVAGVSYGFTLNWYTQDDLTQDAPAVLNNVMTGANNAPAFVGSLTHAVDEQVGNQPPVAAGTVLTTLRAEDSDNDAIAYSIQGGDDARFFVIGEQSGVLSLARGVRFDREKQSAYTFVVQVRDSYGRTSRELFEVSVDDVNEPPVLPEQQVQRTVVGATITFTVALAADPEGDTIEYEAQVNGGSLPDWLSLDRATGQFEVSNAAPAGTHQVEVKAAEIGNSPNLESAARTFAVVVASDATNIVPNFISPLRFELREDFEVPSRRTIGLVEAFDGDGDRLTYRMRGDDAALFVIGSTTGRIDLRARREFNREDKAEYVFVVEADDGKGGVVSALATIAITEVNEPPSFGPLPNQRVVQGVYSTFVVAPATDPEDDPLVYTASNPGPWLVFAASTRTFTVLPSARSGRYTLVITATEADTGLDSEEEFVLHIQTAGNQPPEFEQSKVVFELLENRGLEITPAGTPIGQVEASDPDLHPLSYQIVGGDDAAQFDIDRDSGRISLAAALILRAAIKGSYVFIVEADDGNGETARIEVEVVILASAVPKEEMFSLAVVDKAIAHAAVDLISSRMDAAATGARSLEAGLAGDDGFARLRMDSATEQWSSRGHDDASGGERMRLQDFIYERGFDLSLRRARGLEPRFWGAGSKVSQKGNPVVEDVAIPYDGDVDVLMLGMDVGQEWRRLGLAVSRSSARFTVGEESAAVERSLRSLHPYVSWQTTRNIVVWLAAGYGKGDYSRVSAGRVPENREASHLSLAGGLRGGWEFRGYEFGVGIKATGTRSDLEASRELLLAESSAESRRTQLDFELARSFRTTANLVMRPFVGGDLRYDSVDTIKATAIDARAGLRVDWSKALSADVSGRWQIKDDEMSESSLDGSINYDYGADQRGLMLSVTPRLERNYHNDGAPSLRRVVQASAKYKIPVRLFKNSGTLEIKSDRNYSSDAQSASYGLGLSLRQMQVDLSARSGAYGLKLRIE